MTISTITRDRRYPMPGDTVTLAATYDTGTRVRFRLLSKPAASRLQAYDEALQNYLTRSQLTPDVAGAYVVEAIEETVAFDPPRFEGDTGDATLHGGSVRRGLETITASPVALRYVVPVCQRLTRRVGFGDDVVTVEINAGAGLGVVDVAIPTHWVWNPAPPPGHLEADEWVHQLEPASWGAITRMAGETLAPTVTGAETVMARHALSQPAVLLALRDLGAADFGQMIQVGTNPDGSPSLGHRGGETLEILPWSSICEADPFAHFALSVEHFNAHCTRVDLAVHVAPDMANVAPALAGPSIAQQATFLDGFVPVLTAHASDAAHASADTILSAALSALAPLGAAPSLSELCDRCNLVWSALDAHLTRIYLPGVTPQVHLQMADNRLDAATYPKAIDATTSNARCAAMRTAYDNHRQRTNHYAGGDYHAIAASTAETFTDALPDNRDAYIAAVGKLSQLVAAHLENRDSAGSTKGYHASADVCGLSAMHSAPTNFEDAVREHEAIDWTLATHAAKGSPTHAIAWPGAARPSTAGIEALAHAWLDVMAAPLLSSGTLPGNESEAAVRFAACGWTREE